MVFVCMCVWGGEEGREGDPLAVIDVMYLMVIQRTWDYIAKVSIPVVRKKKLCVFDTNEAC